MTTPGKNIFFGISSFQILAMFRRGLFYSYLSIYLRFFLGLSVTETTLYATLPMLCNVVFQNIIWGRLCDKYQLRRTLIIIGEITAAIITAIVWYVHTIPESTYAAGYVIIIGLSIVEIFWSMSNVGWSALLSDIYPREERTGIQGKMAGFGAIGRFVGVLIGGLLYDGLGQYYDGWGFKAGPLFLIASGVMLISIIPMFFMPEGGIDRKKGTSDPPQVLTAGMKNSISRRFTIFLISIVFIFFGMNSVVMLKAQYLTLEDGFHVSSQELGFILNMGTLAMFIVGMALRKLSKRMSDDVLLMIGSFLLILYLLGYMLSPKVSMIYVSDLLFGAAQVIIFSSSYAYASKLIPPESRGRQFAMYNTATFLSWGLPGTIITGPLTDYLIKVGHTQVYSYRMAFLAAVVMVAIGGVILKINSRQNSEDPVSVIPDKN